MRQTIEKQYKLHRVSRLNLFLQLFLVLCFTQQLSADSEDFDRWDSILHNEEFLHSVEPPDSYFDKKNWNVSIGMIGGSAPKYRGADENEFGYAPLVRIIWKDLIFLRSRKLGVYVYEDDKNTLGG